MSRLFCLALILLSSRILMALPLQTPRFHKVVYIVLENTTAKEALSNPVLKNFAKQGSYFSKFMAETHPSQGNYIAMIAGDTLGVQHDGVVNFSERHLGDLLEAKGMNWKVYAEDYPGNCFTGEKRGKYVRKHVPFMSFRNVSGDPARCARIVNMNDLPGDWSAGQLSNFNLVVPNLDNDGHDTNVHAAADWLSRFILPLMQDPGNTQDTAVILTFDESTYFGPNQIYTAIYSPALPLGAILQGQVNHVHLLRWLEDEWGLGNLGRGDLTASPLGL